MAELKIIPYALWNVQQGYKLTDFDRRELTKAFDNQQAELSQLRSELAEAQKQRDLWRSVCENDTENEDVCLKLLERFDEKNPEYPTGLVERVELAMKKLTASESARRVLVEEFRLLLDAVPRDETDERDAARNRAVLFLAQYIEPFPKPCPQAAVDSLKLLEGEG